MARFRRRFKRFIKRFGKKHSRFGRFRRGAKRFRRSSRMSRAFAKKGGNFWKSPWPDKSFVKFTFSKVFSLVPGASSVVNSILKGNSAFQPDGASVTPAWDNWFTRYAQAICKGSAIKVTPLGTQSPDNATLPNNLTQSMALMVYPIQGTAAQSTLATSQLGSIPYSKWRLVPYQLSSYARPLKHYISTKKIYGMSKMQFEGSLTSFAQIVNADPTSEWSWIVSHQTITGSNFLALTQIGVLIQITYYYDMFNRDEIPDT